MNHKKHRANNLLPLESISVTMLCITLLVLPIQRFDLPLNTAIPDYVNFLALFILWLFIIKNNIKLRLPFLIPMWLIWFASLLSAFYAPNHFESLQVIAQEVYLYFWFVSLTIILGAIQTESRDKVYKFWVFAAVINGTIILTQFVSPEFLQQTTAFVGKYDIYGSPRPLGLYKNPNIAANFQVLAFVPLYLISKFPKWLRFSLTAFLVLTIVGTGSLGVSLAFVCGIVCSFVLLQTADKTNVQKGKFFFQLVLCLALVFAGFQLLNQQFPLLAERLDFLYYSRFGGSAENRLTLWEQGQEVVANELAILGLGPGAFKDSILGEKALHNDAFSFLVERGLLGAFGLFTLSILMLQRIIKSWRTSQLSSSSIYTIPILLAAFVAIVVTSQTHEVFHFRSVWLATAVIESTTYSLVAGRAQRLAFSPSHVQSEDVGYQQA